MSGYSERLRDAERVYAETGGQEVAEFLERAAERPQPDERVRVVTDRPALAPWAGQCATVQINDDEDEDGGMILVRLESGEDALFWPDDLQILGCECNAGLIREPDGTTYCPACKAPHPDPLAGPDDIGTVELGQDGPDEPVLSEDAERTLHDPDA